nr:MAG TPA: hypothetical protein [Bacteriophage sp.]DAK81768.1 MAG TPA: hypothetical protein [Bacteriophage sp.]DAR55004.1 MAG TPA: hypothetical protein [Bacteriophage sp.]
MLYVIVISLDCLNQIIRCQKKSTSLSSKGAYRPLPIIFLG